MSSVILTMIGLGFFYCVLLFYIAWVVLERTFFAGSDPERWAPYSQADEAGSAAEGPWPLVHVPSATPLGRAA